MGRTILTGDKHAEIRKIITFAEFLPNATKDDILIVLGDFGCIWNRKQAEINLEILGDLPMTIAFVDGNHENFNLINEWQKIEIWNGGLVGMLPNGIIHLLRGEIYNINGKTIGVCGGANSVDRGHREEGVTWWPDEDITDNDIANFKYNLTRTETTKLDCMLTHTCPASMVSLVALYSVANGANVKPRNAELQLEKIQDLIQIDKWYFGHWHLDMTFNDKFKCLYHQFLQI